MFKKELNKLIHQCKVFGCLQARSKGLCSKAKVTKEIKKQKEKIIRLYEKK